jgi:hypothetical protein
VYTELCIINDKAKILKYSDKGLKFFNNFLTFKFPQYYPFYAGQIFLYQFSGSLRVIIGHWLLAVKLASIKVYKYLTMSLLVPRGSLYWLTNENQSSRLCGRIIFISFWTAARHDR